VDLYMDTDLIYDIGLHKGEDTEYYLKKGFRVVGIEANPDLAAQCRARFKSAIASGHLRIVEGAIAPASSGDTVTFYKNDAATIWGTIDSAWAERNTKRGYNSEKIELRRVDMVEVFRTFKIPLYLKIDVEGADSVVLDSLRSFTDRPRYLSIESDKVDFSRLKEELSTLRELGYCKFKAVQQRSIPGTRIRGNTLDGGPFEHTFEECSSGPFGEDIPQPWLTMAAIEKDYENIFTRYHYFGDRSTYTRLPKIAKGVISTAYKLFTGHRGPLPGWYDTHASL
jgi:FkbM family methyltransferase